MKHFAVIGAGAAGLSAAKHLLARGLEVTIYEVGTKIGGLWVYENDSGLSAAYRSLYINSESRNASYTDFPFPADTPLFLSHREMHRYFELYAEHHDLVPRIRFSSRVVAIEPQGDKYGIRLEDGDAATFDGVVVATGHQSVPRNPPEFEAYTGRFLHAHDYRVPEPFAGERVLVIGPGNSGVDIAADICTLTEQTVLSARSPVLIMPRMLFGVPASRILGRLEKPWVPWALRIRVRAFLVRIVHGRMETWGFRTPKTRTHPISHPTLITHMAWNRVIGKPGIESVEGREVRFTDGTSDSFDSVIAATGYLTEFPFLPEGTSPVSGSSLDLYQRIVHPGLPGVYFIGFFDVTGGGNIAMMDTQSEYLASIVSRNITLPSAEQMTRHLREDQRWAAKQFPGSPRYGLELDPRYYKRRLAKTR